MSNASSSSATHPTRGRAPVQRRAKELIGRIANNPENRRKAQQAINKVSSRARQKRPLT